jgi:site-specific recombinase XerD
MLTAFKQYLLSLKLSAVSRKLYFSDVRRFMVWLAEANNISFQEITLDLITSGKVYVSYLAVLKSMAVAPSMLKRTMASLRQLSTFITITYGVAAPSLDSSTPSTLETTVHCDYIKHFTKYLNDAHLSPLTIKSYKSDITRYLDWAHTNLVGTQLTELLIDKNILKYLNHLTQSLSTLPSTIERKEKSILRFQAWYLKVYSAQSVSDNNLSSVKAAKVQLHSQSERLPHSGSVSSPTSFLSSPDQSIFSVKNLNYRRAFAFAILMIFAATLGIFGYRQFSRDVRLTAAYPSTPVTPNRQLSFQGRLEDAGGTPIATATDIEFKLWNDATVGSQLYTSGVCSITPDADGVFSSQIGSTCGAAIASSVFTENSNVWLEVIVGSPQEILTPRQPIASVAYALNSETLQGFPISSTVSAIRNTVVPMNQWGEIIIGEQNPRMKGVSGTFSISAPSISITTATGTNGNITLAPDGTGQINFNGNTTTTNFFNVSNAQLTTGSLITGTVANNNSGFKLIDLLSGSSPTSKFSVSDTGLTRVADDLYVASGISLYNNAVSDGTVEATKFCTGDGETNCATDFSVFATGTNYWTKSAGNVSPLTLNDTISATTSASTALTLTQTGAFNALLVEDQASDPTPFIIDQNGNVGIGKTAANALLDVAGTASVSGVLTLGNGTINALQSPYGPLSLNYKSGLNAWTTGLTLQDTTGNLGIGDTTPASLFTVGNGDLFQINSSGIIASIDGVAHTIDDISGNLTLTSNSGLVNTAGDFTIAGDDLFMTTNTAGYLLIADGTNYNPTAVSGDITLNGSGVTAIGADKITESMLKSVNGPTDEMCLSYEATVGDFEWQACGSGGGGSSNWRYNLGTLSPLNDTVDLLVGGNATSSARAAFLNIGSGTPTASVSAGVAGGAFLTADGTLSTTARQSLILGNSASYNTTGNIFLNPNGVGNVGIGTTTADSKLTLLDTSNTAASFSLTNNTATTLGAGGNTLGVLDLQSTSLTTGNFLNLETNALTSGKALNLSSTSTTLTSGNLLALDWSPGSATTSTGDLFSLNIGANGNAINLMNIKDNGSSVFSVSETAVTSNLPTSFTSAGDVSMAYDLNFTNPTASYVKSAAPLTVAAGEVFNSSNLTLQTYNSGDVVVDSPGGVTLNQAQAWDIANTSTSALNIEAGLLNFDTTNSRIGIGDTTPDHKLDVAGNIGLDVSAYINWGDTDGTTGYGFRDNAGVMEYKNSAGAWAGIGSGGASSWTDGGTFLYPTTAETLGNSVSGGANKLTGLYLADAAPLVFGNNNNVSFSFSGSTLGSTLTAGTRIGIGTTSGLASLDIRSSLGTIPVASISGDTSMSTLIVDQSGIGDLFTASKSGDTKFVITNAGNVGIGVSNPTNKLEIGGSTSTIGNASGDITIDSASNNVSFAGDSLINILNTYIAGEMGIGLSDAVAKLDVHGAMVGKALVMFDEIGDQDLMTASASGITRMRLTNSGSLTLDGDYLNFGLTDGTTGYGIRDNAGSMEFKNLSGSWAAIGTNWWDQVNGTIQPYNKTVDLLLGGTATSSAKFAVLNMNSGTPTASVSAGITGAAYLTGTGILATTAKQTLALGDATTTGNIIIQGGNVGIGVASPVQKLEVNGYAVAQRFEDSASSAYYLDPAATGTSISIDGNIVSNGAFSITSNATNGNITLDAGSGTVFIGTTGAGKLDAGTIDPPYTINGNKFATYMAGMTGVKEETTGNVTTTEYINGSGYRATLDLANATEGSDLWLFSKAASLRTNLDKMVVLLSSSGNTKTWYDIDPTNGKVYLYATSPTSISYRLTAPRFDSLAWLNTRAGDSLSEGHVINDGGSWSVSQTITDAINAGKSQISTMFGNIETNLISPLDATKNITIEAPVKISPITQDTPALTVDGEIDAATISARTAILNDLQAENITAKNITVDTLEANHIIGLDAKIASLSVGISDSEILTITDRIKARLDEMTGNIPTATDLPLPSINPVSTDIYTQSNIATGSATLSSADIDFATVNNFLAVIGTATITTLNVTNGLYTNTISSKDNLLALQPQGGIINLANNTLIVDSMGQVAINGDLTINGKFMANSASLNTLELGTPKDASSSALGSLLAIYNESGEAVATIDASGSANLASLTTAMITIASPGDATSSSLLSSDITTNATAGESTLISPDTELTIYSPRVTKDTLVYLTPTTNTDNKVVFVKAKNTCDNLVPDIYGEIPPCKSSFTIAIDAPASTDISFNWWIIELKK